MSSATDTSKILEQRSPCVYQPSRKCLLALLALIASGCVYIEDGADWSPDERVEIEPFHTFSMTGSADVEIWVCDCTAAAFVDDASNEPPSSGGGHLSLNSGDAFVWSSGGDVRLRTPSLKHVTLNGSGRIVVHGIVASEFTALNNGSGEIELHGDARTAMLRTTGSGDIDADGLATKITNATTTGSGAIELCAFEQAVARVEGSGDIRISCGPRDVDSSVVGSGDVELD